MPLGNRPRPLPEGRDILPPMAVHVVLPGECLSSIARRYGFSDWRTLWDFEENAELRRRRPNPNVILPGDRVAIPEREARREAAPTEQRHSFRRRSHSTLLRLLLQDEERRPWSGRRYELTVEGQTFEGATASDGRIEHEIPPDAVDGELVVWLPPRPAEAGPIERMDDDGEGGTGGASPPAPAAGSAPAAGEQPFRYELAIGHLDPVDEVSGVQARLRNLGFDCGEIDGVAGPVTRGAIERFQHANGLAVDGVAGPATRRKLEEVHGC